MYLVIILLGIQLPGLSPSHRDYILITEVYLRRCIINSITPCPADITCTINSANLAYFSRQRKMPKRSTLQLSNPHPSAARESLVLSFSWPASSHHTLPANQWLNHPHGVTTWGRPNIQRLTLLRHHQWNPDLARISRRNTGEHRQHPILHAWSTRPCRWWRDSLNKWNIARRSCTPRRKKKKKF